MDVNKLIESRAVFISAIKNAVIKDMSFVDIVDNINLDVKNDYLTFSLDNPMQVSYSLKGNSWFDVKQRRRTKLGRYLHKTYSDELKVFNCSDSKLDEFVNNVLEHTRPRDGSFNIINGYHITNVYDECVGGNTCMSDGNEAVDMYAHNDNIRMLIYRHINTARALVWTCDDGTIVMDRIYPNSGSHIKIMQKYAVDQGWVYRIDQRLPKGDHVELSDNKTHCVTVKSDNQLWPYMDTFRFATGNVHKATLRNYLTLDSVGILDDVDGGFPCSNLVQCNDCSNQYSINTMTTISGFEICEECLVSNYTFSNNEDMYLRSDDCYHVRDINDYVSDRYVSNNCETCSVCDDIYYNFETYLYDLDDSLFCECCLETVSDICCDCGTRHNTENLDDNNLCDNCKIKTE